MSLETETLTYLQVSAPRMEQCSSYLVNDSPFRTFTSLFIRLYVGSLHFNLTESDIRQLFEFFGELEFVDLHRDPTTGCSKGYAFVQYKRAEDAKEALQRMEGFPLAGRTVSPICVHYVLHFRHILLSSASIPYM
jgi:RNA recognition motif-containing protein